MENQTVQTVVQARIVTPEYTFLSYIEPRPDNPNRAYTAAHLAGSTKKVLKRKKLSTTKGNAQGKSKLVSYVPISMLDEAGIKIDNAYPDKNPHITVQQHQRTGTYKNFTWGLR